ncbi:DsbA family protein [Chelatococcus asaccharovorans]|uniref:DsbA family protein n=1 Tax=Chelatococcus asaccharovorans TaxID=28210 RepID=UPI00224C78D1|nr:DsbA family protein [Chelatococcus asaccharovorans]CAH1670146.1 Protein-disulfide isomerase [Chelatococcus asaccharovorans]CAH1678422.1 Protein-disulfide isomerase [Chelatococcus asaccharovorans]
MRFSFIPRAAAVAIVALLAAPSLMQTSAAAAELSATEKTAIEQVVRDYLLRNPEVLQEAMVELERRQQDNQRKAQEDAVAGEMTALYDAESNIVVGNPKGDVTLVEFFDYNCGYCKRALDDVAQLVKQDPNLRVILKDFPILRPESLDAALYARAAQHQLPGAKFFDYHTRLMGAKGLVGKEQAIAVAKEMGLDMARLQKDATSDALKAEIRETLALGDRLSLTGTPAFVLGKDVVFGAVGHAPLQQAIASVRQCGRTACS